MLFLCHKAYGMGETGVKPQVIKTQLDPHSLKSLICAAPMLLPGGDGAASAWLSYGRADAIVQPSDVNRRSAHEQAVVSGGGAGVWSHKGAASSDRRSEGGASTERWVVGDGSRTTQRHAQSHKVIVVRQHIVTSK